MRKRLLVAIPNYMKEDKDVKMLLRCISSLRLFEPLMIFHVVVFDDASPHFTETAMYDILSSGTKIQDAKKKAASGNPLNADALNAFAAQIKTFLPK